MRKTIFVNALKIRNLWEIWSILLLSAATNIITGLPAEKMKSGVACSFVLLGCSVFLLLTSGCLSHLFYLRVEQYLQDGNQLAEKVYDDYSSSEELEKVYIHPSVARAIFILVAGAAGILGWVVFQFAD